MTNYYNEIKNELINNEIYKKVKDYSKNRNELMTYYNVGKLLNEAGKHYGESIIKNYSKKLQLEVGRTYSERLLFKMKKFYLFITKQKVPTLSAILSWSHYDELLKFEDVNIINYYIRITEEQKLSVRELRKRIKNKEYERLDDKTKLKLIEQKEEKVEDFIKHPILIKNIYDKEKITEKMLQQLILNDMVSFLKELGNGFCFIENEYPIKIGNRYNYIDLLLYNINYNGYVVTELKTTELKKEHIGQIQTYMSYIDKHIKTPNQNPTIGIIICKKDNNYIMKYVPNKNIFDSVYELV